MRSGILGVTALAAMGVLAGCAGTASGEQAGAPTSSQAAYGELITSVYGTAQDRVLAEKLQHHNIQTAIAQCMKGKGQDYTIPVYDGVAGAPIVPGDIDGVAPLADDFGIATSRRQHAEGVEANAKLGNPTGDLADKDKQAAYDKALEGCATAGAKFQDSHLPEGVIEHGQGIVNNLNMITVTEEYKDLHRKYVSCLTDAGYRAASWAQLHQLVQEQFPTGEQAWTTLKTSEAWTKAVQFEKQAASVDKACRADLYAHTLAEMGPRVHRLMTEGNGGAVKQVTEEWSRLRAEAAKADITP